MSLVNKKTLLAGTLAAFMAGSVCATGALALDPGYRAPDAEHTLVIETNKGRIVVELYPSLAPSNVARLLALAHTHFYDGLVFHRVIEDFMAQTGDPKGDGTGGSDLPNVPAEFTMRHDSSFPFVVANKPAGSQIGFLGAMPVQSQVNELMPITKDGKVSAWGLYCQGVLGMARDNSPDSANSQFFLMRGSNNVLEKRYTAVGVTLTGLDVIRKLKIGEPPVNPDKMLSVRVLADIPEAERPKIEVMDTSSTQFQAVLDWVRRDKGENFSACDVTVPVKDLNAPPVKAEAPAKPAEPDVPELKSPTGL
ncbi:MAG: peptidylprolyl isomerase [Asticcacaulis sp.]